MTPEEFRKFGHQAVDWIADYIAHPDRYPVQPRVQPGDLTDALPASAPEHGEPTEQLLADFERLIVPAVTHWNHPGFMAYFAISASAPGILAEMLSAALNVNGMLWKTSPAVTELEQVTLKWLRQWQGLPEDWFGIIYDTASTSSMHAVAAAREMADPETRLHGAQRGMVAYTSEQSHSSIEKGAISLGVGQQNVRRIGTDAQFRMRADLLEATIQQDLAAGLRPFFVCASVGTTATTSIDPVPEIADICERYKLWLHIDAAYAGSAAIAPEYRWIFEGCNRADSLVFNPHKWLLTPVDCSVFYTKHPEILRRAFSLVPAYLASQDHPRAVNLMDYGVPLGRRFRALKLWFVMRSFGREGLANAILTHCALARELESWIAADARFEIVAPTNFSVVIFRHRGGDEANRAIVEKVNATGDVFISPTVLNGKVTQRIALGNLATTREHVERVWELVRTAV